MTEDASTSRSLLSSVPAWTGAAIALLLLVLIAALTLPPFRRLENVMLILKDGSIVGTVAVGMTLVIILGGIDLSVGSLLAFAGGLGIVAHNAALGAGAGEAVAFAAGIGTMIAVGLAGGAFNGALITLGRLEPFIATLGALAIFRSAALWIARGGQYAPETGSTLLETLGRGIPIPYTNVGRGDKVIPIEFPYAVLLWLLIVAVGYVLLNHTRLGRHTFAVGSNERAARYSAVNVGMVKLVIYSFIGLCVGAAAMLHTGRYGSVNSAQTGILLELDAIAAVVIGGTLLRGGAGSIIGTVVGVLLIAVIDNVLVLYNAPIYPKGMIKGGVIIIAVLVQRAGHRS